MSRTYKNNGKSYFRNPKTQNSRIVEESSKLEILENEYIPTNRHKTRGNVTGSIPTSYDDLNYSTYPKYKKMKK